MNKEKEEGSKLDKIKINISFNNIKNIPPLTKRNYPISQVLTPRNQTEGKDTPSDNYRNRLRKLESHRSSVASKLQKTITNEVKKPHQKFSNPIITFNNIKRYNTTKIINKKNEDQSKSKKFLVMKIIDDNTEKKTNRSNKFRVY